MLPEEKAVDRGPKGDLPQAIGPFGEQLLADANRITTKSLPTSFG
jgi:hypothetical protein